VKITESFIKKGLSLSGFETHSYTKYFEGKYKTVVQIFVTANSIPVKSRGGPLGLFDVQALHIL
jgi:hypothetical protein